MSRDQFGPSCMQDPRIPRPGTKSLGAVRHGYPDGTSEKSGAFIDEAAVRRKIAQFNRAMNRLMATRRGLLVSEAERAIPGHIMRNARLAQLILRQHKKAA